MLLECDAVEKAFDDGETRVPVLRGVSFALKARDTMALTGESGSGKSTLLHIAAGLEPADAGSVRVLGRSLENLDDRARARMRRHEIALVFQQFNLIPSLSVGANITFHARLANRLDTKLTDAIVCAFGLGDHLDKFPEALSGGQQQRVAIARALAASPKLLLADEPTGNLDEDTADKVMAQMLALVDRTGAGLLVVSHSEKVAAAMARRLHLSGGRLA